jgi:hypothetical protein
MIWRPIFSRLATHINRLFRARNQSSPSHFIHLDERWPEAFETFTGEFLVASMPSLLPVAISLEP